MGFRLSWLDNNLAEDGHRIYRSTSSMDPDNLPSPLVELGVDITTYDDADSIVPGETYYYIVSAFKGSVERLSEELSVVADESFNGIVGCALFNGTDGGIDAGNSSAPSSNNGILTVEARVTFLSLDGHRTIVEDAGSTKGWGLALYQDNLVIAIENNDTHRELAYPVSNLSINQPYHIAATLNGPDGELGLYVNGVLVAFDDTLDPFTDYDGSDPLTIGSCEGIDASHENSPVSDGPADTPGNGFFHGKISEVRVWDILRTQQQIVDDRDNRLVGDETGLYYYWPLNESTGTVASELVSGLNGDLTGGVTWKPEEYT